MNCGVSLSGAWFSAWLLYTPMFQSWSLPVGLQPIRRLHHLFLESNPCDLGSFCRVFKLTWSHDSVPDCPWTLAWHSFPDARHSVSSSLWPPRSDPACLWPTTMSPARPSHLFFLSTTSASVSCYPGSTRLCSWIYRLSDLWLCLDPPCSLLTVIVPRSISTQKNKLEAGIICIVQLSKSVI